MCRTDNGKKLRNRRLIGSGTYHLKGIQKETLAKNFSSNSTSVWSWNQTRYDVVVLVLLKIYLLSKEMYLMEIRHTKKREKCDKHQRFRKLNKRWWLRYWMKHFISSFYVKAINTSKTELIFTVNHLMWRERESVSKRLLLKSTLQNLFRNYIKE